jgi:ABC-2 type transport system permease protein
MNRYRILTKTFIKALGMSQAQDKRRKIMIVVLSLFAVFGVLLPVAVGSGLLVKLMTETLIPLGAGSAGLELVYQVITLFTMIFGINVIFNEFYFSNDIEYLLPWPLRAHQIVAAKFSATLQGENVMQAILVISCIVGYGTASHMGILNWLLSLIGVVTLPILPFAYCGILSILVMGLTRVIRNKDMIQKISVALMFIMVIVLVASIGFLQNMDIDNYVETLAGGSQPFLVAMGYIFPNVPLFVKMFTEGSVTALLGYIAVNGLAIGVMLLLAELLYFRGVIGLSSTDGRKKTKGLDALLAKSRQHSPAVAYFLKEVRILVRTPVFFTNCIAVNFLWPVFVYAMYKIQSRKCTLAELRDLYAAGNLKVQLLFLLGIVGVSVIVTAINSLSSNAISREGKHFSFMKYIPVSYQTQWDVKVFTGILFPAVGILIYFIPACILIRVPLLHILLFTVLSLASITFVSYMGIYIDSIQPKLIWDDELSALRENYNTFFSMAIAIAFAAVVCVGGFFLFCNTKLSIEMTGLILLLVLAVANILVLRLAVAAGPRNIEEQEEA